MAKEVSVTWKYLACISLIGLATVLWDDRAAIKKDSLKAIELSQKNTADIETVKNAIMNLATKKDIADLHDSLWAKLFYEVPKQNFGPKTKGEGNESE